MRCINIVTERFNDILNGVKEITIVGYFGADNFGDDLMLKSLIDVLDNKSIKFNIFAHGKIKWIDKSIHVEYWNYKDKLSEFRSFNKLIKNSSLILWGGGTCFTDEDGDGLFKYMLYAKLIGKKIGYAAVGIGNLNRFSRSLKTKVLLNISNYISFRDKTSLERAVKMLVWKSKNKFEYTEDLANVILQKYNEDHEKNPINRDILTIAWRNLDNYNTEEANDYLKISNFCLELCEKNNISTIQIINTDSTYDNEVGEKLYEILNDSVSRNEISIVFNHSDSYEEKLELLYKSRVVVTSRLHVAVAANYFNQICYVYNYSPKIKYFVQELNNNNIYMLDENFMVELN